MQAGAGSNYPFLTSKERDNESGLDFFDARYYSSKLGRFISVDPLMASGSAQQPQSWNRYGYCLNNPLRFVDNDGMEVQLLDGKALDILLTTLPEDVRGQVKKQVDENGTLRKGALDNIKSKDENLLALRSLVNFSGMTEVASGSGVEVSGTTLEFSYQTADGVKQTTITNMIANGTSPEDAAQTADQMQFEPTFVDGYTLSKDQSPSGNARVVVANGTGKTANEPPEELAAAMGHELYVHALLLQQGKEWRHDTPGGPDRSHKEAEDRSRRNATGQPKQATPRGIKPSN